MTRHKTMKDERFAGVDSRSPSRSLNFETHKKRGSLGTLM